MVIPDSVTTIGDEAFSDCSSLTRVVIPDSVTTIGDYAFYSCDNLTSVVIPDSVTTIGERAFKECSSLTSVVLSNSVTTISAGAFYYCKSLTIVVIPDSVTTIGDWAFAYCRNLTSVVIPDSVTTIGEHAFYNCDNLTSVAIGDGVTIIGDDAFNHCSGLTSVVIPDSVTTIGDDAFNHCSVLTSVYYKGSSEDWDKISVDSYNTYLTSATRYYYSETKPTTEGDYWHFVDDVPTVWEKVLPTEGVIYTKYDTYAEVTGYEGTATDVVIASMYEGLPVTTIGDRAFESCNKLTGVVIPDSVMVIGEFAFTNATNLQSVTIGDGVRSFDESAFDGTAYYNDSTNWENGVLYIGKYLISASSMVSGTYTIKEGTLGVLAYAFQSCQSLTDIVIPQSVTFIGEGAFQFCQKLVAVHIEDMAAWCNISFENHEANPLWYAHKLYLNNVLVTDLVIENTTEIKEMAFYSCTSLTSVTISKGVTSIGMAAFVVCSNLTSVTISQGVTSIGTEAFLACRNLTSITIANSVTSIEINAFLDCTSLTEITFEGTIAQWNAISKGKAWNYNTPVTKVECSDGSVSLL